MTRLLFMEMNDWRMVSRGMPASLPRNSMRGSRSLMAAPRSSRVPGMSLPMSVVSTSSTVPSRMTPATNARSVPVIPGRAGWMADRPAPWTHQRNARPPAISRHVRAMSATKRPLAA